MENHNKSYNGKKTLFKRVLSLLGVITILFTLTCVTASASASGGGSTCRVLYCPDYMTNVDESKSVTTVCDVPSNIVIQPFGYNYNWNSSGTDLNTGVTFTLSSFLSAGEYLNRQYYNDTFRSTFSTGGNGFDGVTYVWKDTTYNQSLYGCTIEPRSTATNVDEYHVKITANVAVIRSDNTFQMHTVETQRHMKGSSYLSMFQIHEAIERRVEQVFGENATIWRTINNQKVCYTQSLEVSLVPRDSNGNYVVDNTCSFREWYDYDTVALDSRACDFFSTSVIPPVEFGILDWVGSAVAGVTSAPLFYIGGSVPFTIGTALMVILGLGIFGLFMKLYAGG